MLAAWRCSLLLHDFGANWNKWTISWLYYFSCCWIAKKVILAFPRNEAVWFVIEPLTVPLGSFIMLTFLFFAAMPQHLLDGFSDCTNFHGMPESGEYRFTKLQDTVANSLVFRFLQYVLYFWFNFIYLQLFLRMQVLQILAGLLNSSVIYLFLWFSISAFGLLGATLILTYLGLLDFCWNV